MKYFFVILLIGVVSLPTLGYLHNHSFVFISGWPQSGTSLVHQVMSFNPDMSSVIELCEKILGKRCISWNHESQWIFPGNIRDHLRSGAMCPVNSVNDDIRIAVQQQLKQYWHLEKPYLIEKSPQSMVKIPMLQSIFNDSQNIKFIVVIKHPVTLNIATDKLMGWRYFREATNAPLRDPKTLSYSQISQPQMIDNAKLFLNLMNSNITNSSTCSLGWLPAMSYLHNQLQSGRLNGTNIRIVRYESFSKPIPLCVNIFRFVYGAQRSGRVDEHITSLCQNIFRNMGTASTGSVVVKEIVSLNRNRKVPRASNHRQLDHIDNSTSLDILTTSKQASDHRLLRLRTDQDQSFKFRPELVHETCKQRIDDFNFAYAQLPLTYQKQLDDVDVALQRFGYKLREPYRASLSSVLQPWELQWNT